MVRQMERLISTGFLHLYESLIRINKTKQNKKLRKWLLLLKPQLYIFAKLMDLRYPTSTGCSKRSTYRKVKEILVMSEGTEGIS